MVIEAIANNRAESKRGRHESTKRIDDFMGGLELKQIRKPRDDSIIESYRMGQVLGKGGFAKVFKAERIISADLSSEPISSSTVAVKVIPKKRVSRPDQAARIENEISIQSKMKHRNVAALLSAWSDDEKYILVIEYCEEKTLLCYMKLYANKRVPELETAMVMSQLCRAVEYLHKNDIIHRDIKLGNVLRTGNCIKLADFGLAINFRTENSRHICGTPNFLSPEVYAEKYHSPASDIWAVGCVLYSLLAGANPFEFTDLKDTGKRIMNMEFTIPEFFSDEAKEAIQCIMTDQHKFRPSAREVLKLPLFAKYGIMPLGVPKDSKHRRSKAEPGPSSRSRSKTNPENEERTCKRALFCKPLDGDKNTSGDSSASSRQNREPLGQINNNDIAPTTTVTRSRFTKSKKFARSLLNEIETAPNSSVRKRNREMPDCHRYQPAFKQVRHQASIVYVTKWIDYYEQIGLGYKLSDATINILLRNGDTAKGRGNDKVRLLSDEGVRTISIDSTNRRDRAAAKHWVQFEQYMSKNLVDGITANSQEPDEYGNVTVRYFERDDRAIIFQLSNGVKQINFLNGPERGTKFIISNDGLILVEKRIRKYLSWNDLDSQTDDSMVNLLIYAHDRFHSMDRERRGSQGNCDRSEFCQLMNKLNV